MYVCERYRREVDVSSTLFITASLLNSVPVMPAALTRSLEVSTGSRQSSLPET
jgi:hypothetical protein